MGIPDGLRPGEDELAVCPGEEEEELVIPSERSERMGIPDGLRPGEDELAVCPGEEEEELVIPSERSERMGIPDGLRPGEDEVVPPWDGIDAKNKDS